MVCYPAHGDDGEGLECHGYRVDIQTMGSLGLDLSSDMYDDAPEACSVYPYPANLHYATCCAWLGSRRGDLGSVTWLRTIREEIAIVSTASHQLTRTIYME